MSTAENDDGSWVPSLPDMVDLKGKIDAGEVKACSRCGEVKPAGDFGPRLKRCKTCLNESNRKYRANSRYKARDLAWHRAHSRLRQAHPDEFATLLVEEEAALGVYVQRYRR